MVDVPNLMIYLFLPFFRQTQLSKLEEERNNLREDVERINVEKADLLVQIEAGEGMNTALQQLKQQNVRPRPL